MFLEIRTDVLLSLLFFYKTDFLKHFMAYKCTPNICIARSTVTKTNRTLSTYLNAISRYSDLVMQDGSLKIGWTVDTPRMVKYDNVSR